MAAERIIVTEIPFMVNKAMLVQKIAELARDKVIDGITGFVMNQTVMGCGLPLIFAVMLVQVWF